MTNYEKIKDIDSTEKVALVKQFVTKHLEACTYCPQKSKCRKKENCKKLIKEWLESISEN